MSVFAIGRFMTGGAGAEYAMVTGIVSAMTIAGICGYERGTTRFASATAAGMGQDLAELAVAEPTMRMPMTEVVVPGAAPAVPAPTDPTPVIDLPVEQPAPVDPVTPEGCGTFGGFAVLEIDGRQLAGFSSLAFNGQSETLALTGLSTFGTARYTVLVDNLAEGDDEFRDGHAVTIRAADGAVVMERTIVAPSGYARRNAGEEHLVIRRETSPWTSRASSRAAGRRLTTMATRLANTNTATMTESSTLAMSAATSDGRPLLSKVAGPRSRLSHDL